ncbi:MAG: S53 family peptidase, partial [Nitrososphaerales archaeon]
MASDGSPLPFQPSLRSPPSGERVGAPAPSSEATITVYLRGQGIDPVPGRLSREEYAVAHGASPEDVDAIRRFASDHGLSVTAVRPERRSVELSGTIAALCAAFGVTLGLYRVGQGAVYRGREGVVYLPPELHPLIKGVFGLDERPQARPQFRPRADASSPYTPPAVAAAYRFPTGVTGAGECVALIELGGGFREEDLNAYFASLGLKPPTVEAVPVGQGGNDPGSADGPDGEVMLDIEVVGALAPDATIAVYFAANTDQGFIDAVNAAVHDATRRPSVISISWG